MSAEANRAIPISARDAQVAVTVIQWLGSPIGQAFLEDTLGIENLRKQVSAILPKLAPV
ncbi:MAG: hypothetical protein ACREAU_01245 [Nitrosopumilaceae archaeon]